MSKGHHDHYFKRGTPAERWLRFFNLLEPNHMVLSLSKLGVWASAALILYVLIWMPDKLLAVIGAVGTGTVTAGNYAYRRSLQYANNESPYGEAPPTVDTVSPEAQDEALKHV